MPISKDDVKLPDDPEDEYPPWLKPKVPDPPPPPPTPLPLPADGPKDPFAPRGYDLPADPEPAAEDLQYIAEEKLASYAIVEKAIQGAGLSFSGQSASYAEFLFPAEFTASPVKAQAMARTMSSCGIFARACYAAAGATYYFNPEVKTWLGPPFRPIKKYGGGVTAKEGGSTNSTVHIENPNKASGAVGKALGPAVVVKNYFTDEYLIGSVVSAFITIGLSHGALKYGPRKSKKMCTLAPGDLLIISPPDHIIVCISEFDPDKDTYFDAVEGGQSDMGNTPAPVKNPMPPPTVPTPPGKGYSPTAFAPSRFFWNLSNANAVKATKASVDDHAAGGNILKKFFSSSAAAIEFSTGRQLLYVIEAAKFIV